MHQRAAAILGDCARNFDAVGFFARYLNPGSTPALPPAGLLRFRDGKRVRLFTRNGHDWSHRYPLIMARRIDDLASFEQGEIGPELFRHACLMGLEGLIPKHRESAYRAGRSPRWIKVKNRQHAAFSRMIDTFA